MKFSCGHEAAAGVGGLCINCHLKSEKKHYEPVKKKNLPVIEKRSFTIDVNNKRARNRLLKARKNGTVITKQCANTDCARVFETAFESQFYCSKRCRIRMAERRRMEGVQ